MPETHTSSANAGLIVVCVIIGYALGKVVATEMAEFSIGIRLIAEVAAAAVGGLVAFLLVKRFGPRRAD